MESTKACVPMPFVTEMYVPLSKTNHTHIQASVLTLYAFLTCYLEVSPYAVLTNFSNLLLMYYHGNGNAFFVMQL